jgi:hypothetical protein
MQKKKRISHILLLLTAHSKMNDQTKTISKQLYDAHLIYLIQFPLPWMGPFKPSQLAPLSLLLL